MDKMTYYDERWGKEDNRDEAPNEERIQQIVDAVRTLNKKSGYSISSCLDVGCGNGWILKRMAEILPDCRFSGIEPSTVGALNAQKRVPEAEIECATLETATIKGEFSLVVCSEVLEHVSDQSGFLQTLSNYLSEKGRLVLTMPNGLYLANYFKTCGVTPQPIENWLTGKELQIMMQDCFTDVNVRSFDLSFWRKMHPASSKVRNAAMSLRGGWRFMHMIDTTFLLPALQGLYLIATAAKK